MRDNLATHHHINTYYIYVHNMDPVCTSWDIISPIHVLLVRAILSLKSLHTLIVHVQCLHGNGL
jgi:hypothetical protein